MDELTTAVPKPMLDLRGKSLLQYKLDALPEMIDEVILIVGYISAVIKKHFGESFEGRKVRYVEQGKLDGTAGALWKARDVLRGRFLVMNADDIYSAEDVLAVAAPGDAWRLLVQQKEHLYRSGSVELDDEGYVSAIVEGDHEDRSGLGSTNMFLLDDRLFSQPMVRIREGYPEFGLPQTVVAASRSLGIKIEPVYTSTWIEINSPRDLVYAAQILAEREKHDTHH